MSTTELKSITASVEAELHQRIMDDAAQAERSVSAQVRRILRNHYAQRENTTRED